MGDVCFGGVGGGDVVELQILVCLQIGGKLYVIGKGVVDVDFDQFVGCRLCY